MLYLPPFLQPYSNFYFYKNVKFDIITPLPFISEGKGFIFDSLDKFENS